MSVINGLPRKKLTSQIHPDLLSSQLELWLKATGLLYPNEKALIRIKGIKAGLIPLEIEIGLDHEPPVVERQVQVKVYGGQKQKQKLGQRNGLRKQTRTGSPSSSSEPSAA